MLLHVDGTRFDSELWTPKEKFQAKIQPTAWSIKHRKKGEQKH